MRGLLMGTARGLALALGQGLGLGLVHWGVLAPLAAVAQVRADLAPCT